MPIERSERSEYGPPPGYQPIILPGESISKYQRMAQNKPASFGSGASRSSAGSRALQLKEIVRSSHRSASPPLSEIFATDEPLFADSVQAPRRTMKNLPRQLANQQGCRDSEWDRQQKRLHEMNVAAVFGREDTVTEEKLTKRQR